MAAAMMVWNASSSSSSSVHENGKQQLGGGWRKGPWTPEEDKLLLAYVKSHGEGRWSSVARSSGLNRSGKSCRLRWVNYLRPGLKRGHMTPQEEGIIIELHALWGNKWSTIARYLPGRTDNEIKNYWRTRFKKKPVNKTTLSCHHKKDEQKAQAILHKEMIQHQQQQQQQSQSEAQDHDPMANAGLHENNLEKDAPGLEPMIGYWSWELDNDEDVLWGGLWNFSDTVQAQPGRMSQAGLVFP